MLEEFRSWYYTINKKYDKKSKYDQRSWNSTTINKFCLKNIDKNIVVYRIYFFYLKNNHDFPKNSRLKKYIITPVWVFKSLILKNYSPLNTLLIETQDS